MPTIYINIRLIHAVPNRIVLLIYRCQFHSIKIQSTNVNGTNFHVHKFQFNQFINVRSVVHEFNAVWHPNNKRNNRFNKCRNFVNNLTSFTVNYYKSNIEKERTICFVSTQEI